jgi:rhamnosyltransferase
MDSFRTIIFIPTWNGGDDLVRLFSSIEKQTQQFEVCVVDSSSTDGTVKLVQENGAGLIIIPKHDFNHGGTRQMMIDRFPDYDIYTFLTQDVFLENPDAIERIIAPFSEPSVGAACGRQTPHHDANPFAAHARLFNYPDKSRIKSKTDAEDLGIKTPFLSNSFAAYRKTALEDAGGFPRHVILAEDMYVAARMLILGWRVAYVADACCRHSHNYSYLEEFRRFFDTGVFHSREPWIRAEFGQTGGEGMRYIRSEISYLGLRRIYLWPSAIFRNALKLIGYRLGHAERMQPVWLKKRMSMHRNFWDSEFAG